MTKADVVNQLYNLSHEFNGISNITKLWLRDYIDHMPIETNHLYMYISLPDGCWLMEIEHYDGGWYYYIPDTRDQEKLLWSKYLEETSR